MRTRISWELGMISPQFLISPIYSINFTHLPINTSISLLLKHKQNAPTSHMNFKSPNIQGMNNVRGRETERDLRRSWEKENGKVIKPEPPWLGLSKHIRWPDPPEDPTGTDPKPADSTYSGGWWQIFSTRNRLWGRFRFLSPKNLKTRTNWRKTHNPAKTQIPARKFQILVIKTQISAIKKPGFRRYFT